MSASNDDNPSHPTAAHAPTMASTPGTAPVGDATNVDDPLVGTVVAERYRILSLLGRGGMGSVYVCEHIQLKKRMALKVLAEDFRRQPALVARFLKEARAAAQIGHPNIVDVFDLGELPGIGAYITMTLLIGEDLQAAITRGGPMPMAQARVIVGQICRALAAAHGKGIVHRDMKPANVFLARTDDDQVQVKLLDFGIAQVTDAEGEGARLTQTGSIVGTPAFMSPEQGRGQHTDHRTDIYSVGCILFNLVTGRPPYEGQNLMGVITQHLFDPIPSASALAPAGAIGPAVDALIERAMAKKPEERFQTMKEMWQALEACASDPGVWPEGTSGRFIAPGPTLETGPGMPAQASRGRTALVGAVVALAAMLVAGVVWVRGRPTPVVPTKADVTVPPAPTPPVAREATIELRTNPNGASVLEHGTSLGVTPLMLRRPLSSTPITLELALAGYAEQSVDVVPDRDRALELQLAAVPATKPSHPTHPKTGRPPAVHKAGKAGDLKDPFSP